MEQEYIHGKKFQIYTETHFMINVTFHFRRKKMDYSISVLETNDYLLLDKIKFPLQTILKNKFQVA